MLRIYCLIVLTLTIFLAFFSRAHRIGWYPWDKSLGDALSAFAVYLGFLILRPTLCPTVVLLLGSVFCAGIESFKLTGLPAAWQSYAASRLIFGTTPSLHNLLCYSIALLVAFAIHIFYLRQVKISAVHMGL